MLEIKHFFPLVVGPPPWRASSKAINRASLTPTVCSPQSISRHLEFRSKQLQLGSPYKKLITTRSPFEQGIIWP